MSARASCAGVALSVVLAGCGYRPAELADPYSITLRSAVLDVADTLAEAKRRTKYRDQTGLYPQEATVEFNIASKSTEADTLKIDASAPAGFIFPLSASAQSSLTNEGSRGNTIKITFKNIVDSKMSKEEIKRCLQTPRPKGCPNFMVPP